MSQHSRLLCRYLHHLLQDVVSGLVFGDGADKEATVVHTHTHSDELPGANLKVVKHLNCFEGIVSVPMWGGIITTTMRLSKFEHKFAKM